uniref:Anaphase-promoting complex subunit 5 n=1 Tax=Entomoneis paludosa TaxID=265537 RepID=A0A7S2YKX8_9STRA
MSIRMLELTLDHGLSAFAANCFAAYGTLLCSGARNVEDGYRYGKLGWELYNRFQEESFIAAVSIGYFGCISSWKDHYSHCLEPLKNAFHVALRCGDIAAAGLSVNIYCWNSYEHQNLHVMDSIASSLAERMEFFGQQTTLAMFAPLWQMLQNFMGLGSHDPWILSGNVMTLEAAIDFAANFNPSTFSWISFCNMIVEFCFGRIDDAEKSYHDCKLKILNNPHSAMDAGGLVFFGCLSLLAQARRGKTGRLVIVRKDIQKLRRYAMHAPDNFQGKLLLLQAEYAAVRGKHLLALSKYRLAIIDFRHAGLLMNEALANELLGKYHLERSSSSSEELAITHLKEALRLYRNWGATAKVDHLKHELQQRHKFLARALL